MTVGRKKIYASPEERRKHLRVMYLRTATRDALKAQAKSLGLTVLDYMDKLAATHEDEDTNLYKVVTDTGHTLYLPVDVMLGVINGDIKETDDKLYEVLLSASNPVKK